MTNASQEGADPLPLIGDPDLPCGRQAVGLAVASFDRTSTNRASGS